MTVTIIRKAIGCACLALAPLLATGCVMSHPNNGDHIGTVLSFFQADGYYPVNNVNIQLQCYNNLTGNWDRVADSTFDAAPVRWGGKTYYRWSNRFVRIPADHRYWQVVGFNQRSARFRAFNVTDNMPLAAYDDWTWAIVTSGTEGELHQKAIGPEVVLTANVF